MKIHDNRNISKYVKADSSFNILRKFIWINYLPIFITNHVNLAFLNSYEIEILNITFNLQNI